MYTPLTEIYLYTYYLNSINRITSLLCLNTYLAIKAASLTSPQVLSIILLFMARVNTVSSNLFKPFYILHYITFNTYTFQLKSQHYCIIVTAVDIELHQCNPNAYRGRTYFRRAGRLTTALCTRTTAATEKRCLLLVVGRACFYSRLQRCVTSEVMRVGTTFGAYGQGSFFFVIFFSVLPKYRRILCMCSCV